MPEVAFTYDVFSLETTNGELPEFQVSTCYSIVAERFYRTDLQLEVDFIQRSPAASDTFDLMTEDFGQTLRGRVVEF